MRIKKRSLCTDASTYALHSHLCQDHPMDAHWQTRKWQWPRVAAAAISAGAGAWCAAANAQTFYPAPPVPGVAANAPVPAASSLAAPASPGVPPPGAAAMGAASAPPGTAAPPAAPLTPGAPPAVWPGAPPAIGAPPGTPPGNGVPPVAAPGLGAPPVPVPRGSGSIRPPEMPPPPPVALPRAPLPPAPPGEPVKGLPADAPKLIISGGVYSANPNQRMLIVNGQVVKEGADLGSGVVLQQITPSVVVLAFRGSHYRVVY
jgi:general secretion pathway protein B